MKELEKYIRDFLSLHNSSFEVFTYINNILTIESHSKLNKRQFNKICWWLNLDIIEIHKSHKKDLSWNYQYLIRINCQVKN